MWHYFNQLELLYIYVLRDGCKILDVKSNNNEYYVILDKAEPLMHGPVSSRWPGTLTLRPHNTTLLPFKPAGKIKDE